MSLAEILALLRTTTTGAVSDVRMRRTLKNSLASRIQPLDPSLRLAGPAVTVRRKTVALVPRDGERPRDRFIEMIETAAPGSGMVVGSDVEGEAALRGGLLAAAGARGKLGGGVADGPIRDPSEIVGLKLLAFFTGSVPARVREFSRMAPWTGLSPAAA